MSDRDHAFLLDLQARLNAHLSGGTSPTPPPPPPPVEESCTDFVMRMYRTYLGRDADPGGLAFWSGQCSSGAMTRAQIEDAVKASPERQQPAPPPSANPSAIVQLPWGEVFYRDVPSGHILAIPLPEATPMGRASLKLVQGQRPGHPAPCTIEYQVSKVPGVIDPAWGNLYQSTNLDYNAYEVFLRTRPDLPTPEAILARGAAWAPGPGHFVNVRWLHNNGIGGFPLQWGEGDF